MRRPRFERFTRHTRIVSGEIHRNYHRALLAIVISGRFQVTRTRLRGGFHTLLVVIGDWVQCFMVTMHASWMLLVAFITSIPLWTVF